MWLGYPQFRWWVMVTEDIFLKHRLAIAKSTLKMNDAGAMIMGGMSKGEARDLLKKYGVKFHE
jgi:hypothetical protein